MTHSTTVSNAPCMGSMAHGSYLWLVNQAISSGSFYFLVMLNVKFGLTDAVAIVIE